MPAKNVLQIHGYAIVSRDDCIADALGQMPDALRNDADWNYFQGELDRADLIILGHTSHKASPNFKNRRRLVLSRGARALEQRSDAWWWNPAQLSWPEAAARLLPGGGRVGVPGGRAVFDYFLDIGFSAFHLSRAKSVLLPKGHKLFSACSPGITASAVLRAAHLQEGEAKIIDESAGVTLTLWTAKQSGAEPSPPQGEGSVRG